jgi:EF-hand domain
MATQKLPPLVNYEEARDLAKTLFDRYDQNRSGYLETNEIEAMMREVASIAKSNTIYPGQFDVHGYVEVLDANRDGKVCYSDVETYVLNFLS